MNKGAQFRAPTVRSREKARRVYNVRSSSSNNSSKGAQRKYSSLIQTYWPTEYIAIASQFLDLCQREYVIPHCKSHKCDVCSTETSRSILEAFYYGRAFAETLNAKVGAALEDILSDISKQSAESTQAVRWVCHSPDPNVLTCIREH